MILPGEQKRLYLQPEPLNPDSLQPEKKGLAAHRGGPPNHAGERREREALWYEPMAFGSR